MAAHAPPQPLTRRRLINLVGRAGGVAAAYHTMAAMGLIAVPPAHARAPALARNSGRGTRVIILGAGIAGMTAAYELGKAGYDCLILEARSRAGGRNWTIRGGDRVEEIDSVQTAQWARGDNLYFNAGAARLPHHHKSVLGYCKEFGIPLEVFVNDNRNALLHDASGFGGQPVRMRRVRDDIRGHLAELLAKAIDQGALDRVVSADDRGQLVAFVRQFGALRKDLVYRGSARAGFVPSPGVDDDKLDAPLALATLASNPFWEAAASFGEAHEQAATMLQPVGGMDRIAAAFARRLRPMIRFNAEVRQIRRSGERGARVVYRDRASGPERAADADFVLVTIPLCVLKDIDADFSARHKAAIATGAAAYVPVAKIAFEAKRRFWEEDEQIYGGISWTTQDITQIWYPSTDFHGRGGIVLGAYIWTSHVGETFAALAPAARIERALAQGEKLHPTYRADLGKGVAVSWPKVPFSSGAWCVWSDWGKRNAYPVLLEPDGPFLFAGEHLSELRGWQEGAMLSAYQALAALAARVTARRN